MRRIHPTLTRDLLEYSTVQLGSQVIMSKCNDVQSASVFINKPYIIRAPKAKQKECTLYDQLSVFSFTYTLERLNRTKSTSLI